MARRLGGIAAFGILTAISSVSLSAPALAADLVIGIPSWPSADVTAQIIAKTTEKLGASPVLRQRGTMTILADMAQGTVDVHPEVWFPNLTDAVKRLNSEGKIQISAHEVAAAQNICVTKDTAATTGIKSVADLANPEFAKQFDSNGDGMGELWIGAPTWSSTEIEHIRARSYGYDKTMALLELPEDVAMAAVDVASSTGRSIVFYCYDPHHVFDLHELVVLDEPAYDASHWSIVKRADDAEWLEKSNADTAWDASHFSIGYSTSLADEMPKVASYLANIEFSRADIVAMGYAIQVERKSPEDVADEWISENQNRIEEWMQ